MYPFLSAFTISTLSCSDLKGGDSFKNVLKSPISFSFSERLLIETPAVKLSSCLFRSITSIDFREDICEM